MILSIVDPRIFQHLFSACGPPSPATECWYLPIYCTIRELALQHPLWSHTYSNLFVAKLSPQSGAICFYNWMLTPTDIDSRYKNSEYPLRDVGWRTSQGLQNFVLATRWVHSLIKKIAFIFYIKNDTIIFHQTPTLIWLFFCSTFRFCPAPPQHVYQLVGHLLCHSCDTHWASEQLWLGRCGSAVPESTPHAATNKWHLRIS